MMSDQNSSGVVNWFKSLVSHDEQHHEENLRLIQLYDMIVEDI